jgi:hypothetical protein
MNPFAAPGTNIRLLCGEQNLNLCEPIARNERICARGTHAAPIAARLILNRANFPSHEIVQMAGRADRFLVELEPTITRI